MSHRMPERLLEACERGRRAGKDFPTIWRELLRPNPLVVGLPGHEVAGREARILIHLRTGQTLVSTVDGYSLRGS